MLKYLVTGGCGFIGSHVVDLLLEQGHQVRVLDNCINSSPQFLSPEVEFIEGSITESAALHRAVKGVHGIFHLAALVSVTDSVSHWYKNHLVNCSSTIHLLEIAKGIPTVFASSAAVYGDAPAPHREETAPRPLSPYAIDKLACEMQAQLAWDLHHTPTACFRFFNVYGPRQNPSSPYSGVISKFADQISRNAPITIFGDGNQSRDFIYVKDVAEMLVHRMLTPFQGAGVYNLCTGKGTSINELADLIANIANTPLKKNYAPARAGEILISLGDPTKTANTLGLKAKTTLKEGLTELLQLSRQST